MARLDAQLDCLRALCVHFVGRPIAPEFEPVGTDWWDDMLMAALAGMPGGDPKDALGGG